MLKLIFSKKAQSVEGSGLFTVKNILLFIAILAVLIILVKVIFQNILKFT